jgi:hypothetical protein
LKRFTTVTGAAGWIQRFEFYKGFSIQRSWSMTPAAGDIDMGAIDPKGAVAIVIEFFRLPA